MLTDIEVAPTSARSTGKRRRTRMRAAGATVAFALLLTGCDPATTTQLTARDPADPAVPVRAVGYRSTIAPYSSLRPATPAPWRERNEQVTPPSRSGRESQ
jgi:hypothetical protein